MLGGMCTAGRYVHCREAHELQDPPELKLRKLKIQVCIWEIQAKRCTVPR